MTFNAEQYQSQYDSKKWVVVLTKHIRRRKPETDIKYVGAKTRDGAVLTAREHSLLRGSVTARARLATPEDLGATCKLSAPTQSTTGL